MCLIFHRSRAAHWHGKPTTSHQNHREILCWPVRGIALAFLSHGPDCAYFFTMSACTLIANTAYDESIFMSDATSL